MLDLNFLLLLIPIITVTSICYVKSDREVLEGEQYVFDKKYFILAISMFVALRYFAAFLVVFVKIKPYIFFLYGAYINILFFLPFLFIFMRDNNIVFCNLVKGNWKRSSDISIPIIIFFTLVILYTIKEYVKCDIPSSCINFQIFIKAYLNTTSSMSNLVYFLGLIIVTPIFEELFFRFFYFSFFEKKIGTFLAVIATSIVWSFFHYGMDAIIRSFLIGLIFGYIYSKSRSVVPTIILHSLLNFSAYINRFQ